MTGPHGAAGATTMGQASDIDGDGDGDGGPIGWARPCAVRVAFVRSVDDFLGELRSRVVFDAGEARLVGVVYDRPPILGPLIEKILDDLAAVGLALWPDWYEGALPFEEIDRSVFAFEERLAGALLGAVALRRPASLAWINAARRLCRAGRKPLPNGISRAVQAAQLALAIAPRDLMVALAVRDEAPPPGRLLGLARAAEWLARTAGARVLVAVPEALSRSSELDGINSAPIVFPFEAPPADPLPIEGRPVGVWPVLGRPHPQSPGEQLLAKRLAADEMLGQLFQFNVHVATRLGNRYLVDLLWPEGRIVVEVDGYEYHSHRLAFSRDRRRDYELVVSGHLVLRLPHDEVMEDVESAVEKIRDLVRFRRSEVGPSP